MASPSSFTSRNYKFNVFASFHGPDVRKTLLSHLREQFKRNGITMFDDQGIERSATIAPSLKEAIKESRISIVILSKKYASSGWCLNELVDILECKKTEGQIVMTIFYGVDPSDVRNQTGDFGFAFNETCARKMDGDRQKWSKALNDVGNIAGEDFFRWDNEAKMIKKIARDVSDKLNATPSRDFDGMVGLEAHLREMESLLDLDYEGVKMVAITGPAGIGKTTIANALHSRLSYRFQLTCFVDNLKGSYYKGLDELRLQEQFLSKVLKQDGIRICHSRVIEERLCKLKVLIILDDVNHIKQLETLANETTWFGPGSRIVVTTENMELLQQHGIYNTYHVGFPSGEQALTILCRYAFRQSYPHDGFKELASRVTELCDKLPLGLRVVGSSLRGKKEDEWEDVISTLETTLHRDIGDVLRVGYESLDENERTLFLHIAVFFNNKDVDFVKTMFANGDLNVNRGLKILVDRSLINICSSTKIIVMHNLLKSIARQAIRKQEPWNRQILTDAPHICDVLENENGTRDVSGISFDISRIDEVFIGERAFKKMPNLRFLKIYKSKYDGNDIMHIPEGMEFPRRLRLLHWNQYPSKCLPPTFHAEYLVELKMHDSQLKYLWQGTQKLTNLKDMDLGGSIQLKELPDLSNATNLETLNLCYCESLVLIPSSFSHLQKLQRLYMENCRNLEVIPPDLNLASSSLDFLSISYSGKLKGLLLTHLPASVTGLSLIDSDIERVPDCIKALHQLQFLDVSGCRRLASLPELPSSLMNLSAEDCESLETVFFPLNTRLWNLKFSNCFKLGKQARKAIIRQSITCRWGEVCLPGRKVPVEFNHRARGNSLTIRLNGIPLPLYTDFVVCVMVSPNQTREYGGSICCRVVRDSDVDAEVKEFSNDECCRKEHLFIFSYGSYGFYPFNSDLPQPSREIVFEFSSKKQDFNIIECGVKICTKESYSNESEPSEVFEDQVSENEDDDWSYDEFEPSKASQDSLNSELIRQSINEGENHTGCWIWLILCFDLSEIASKIKSLVSGRRR